jgi:putative restriction endonuclease
MDVTSPVAARWLGKLHELNVDGEKKTRPIGTAPHKPLLLLVVCDLVEKGALVGGLLHRNGELAFRFGTYWRIVADRRRTKPDLRLPFYHMKSDGFWQPLEADGRPAESRERAVLAQFDVSFLVCLQDTEFRTHARRTLIASHFQPTEQAELYSLVGLPVPPDDIIAADAMRFLPSDREEKKRDAKFSGRVLPAYDFTCALTRHRMLAINGFCPHDAAHIHQFKRGGSCHPTNGITLSKTAHWLFDRGYWSLDDDCCVLVAAQKFDESGEAAVLLKPRTGARILLPPNPLFHPDRTCLRWHRERHGFSA